MGITQRGSHAASEMRGVDENVARRGRDVDATAPGLSLSLLASAPVAASWTPSVNSSMASPPLTPTVRHPRGQCLSTACRAKD